MSASSSSDSKYSSRRSRNSRTKGSLIGFFRRDEVAGLGLFGLSQHRRLVVRQGGAFVELAVDLAVELAHRPAAAQGLGFVEGAGGFVLD